MPELRGPSSPGEVPVRRPGTRGARAPASHRQLGALLLDPLHLPVRAPPLDDLLREVRRDRVVVRRLHVK